MSTDDTSPKQLALRAALEQKAMLEGKRWAEQTRNQIHSERRAAAGGWPGTMSESRARAARLVVNGANKTLSSEPEWLARVVYASAKATWLASRDVEEEVP